MVEFSVIDVPLVRRRQTASLFAFIALAFACLGLLICCVINPILWILFVPYVLINMFVDKAHVTGGRSFMYVKRHRFWKTMASYFPTSIRFQGEWNKDAEPDQQYLFALHPHGVASYAVWTNLLSNGGGLYDALRGLDLKVVTLKLNFFIPIWRELIMALGLIDSSEASILSATRRCSSVGIVVGGATEALDAVPGADCKLTLKRRRGFIRVAMKSGIPIVPVFSFGENDLYEQITHPFLRKIQRAIKKTGKSLVYMLNGHQSSPGRISGLLHSGVHRARCLQL